MKNTNAKMSMGIYLVDKSTYEKLDFDEITSLIIETINHDENNSKSHFIEQPLKDYKLDGFKIKVFYAVKVMKPKWASFFDNIIDDNADLVKSKNQYSTFISFFEYKEDIFAIAGGNGNFNLHRFANQNFGLEILIRIIKKDHKVIKGLQDRGVTGAILGQTKFYRGDQRFSDEDQFGKIYKQVKAELNKEILNKIFGIPNEELKRNVSGCLVKSSFQLNKSIDFSTLLVIISRFSEILKKRKNFSLNKVFLIDKRNNNGKELIEKLDNQLISDLYNTCRDGLVPDFDFCHPEFEKFYSASKYVLQRESYKREYEYVIGLNTLISDMKKDGVLLLEELEQFKHSFLYANVLTLDEDDLKMTKACILDHLQGEIKFDGKTYFRIDGNWYLIQPDYIKELNQECTSLIKDVWDDKLITESFEIKKSERVYNSSFIGKNNCIVLDTITYENIELCDILKYDKENIYLIHVKKGFNNSIRELSSQITVSSKRLLQSLKTDFNFIESIEKKAKKGINSNSEYIRKIATQTFPSEGLRKLFEERNNRNVTFCLAFVDINTAAKSLKLNLKDYQSNIAKFSLLELDKELKSLSFGFKIIQIPRISI